MRYISETIPDDMDDAYYDIDDNCKLVKVGRGTINLLMAYSRSLSITEVDGIPYESHLN